MAGNRLEPRQIRHDDCEVERPEVQADYPLEITIRQVNNGYIITVGCKTLVFQDRADVLDAVDLYFDDPVAAEKKYLTEG